MLNDIILCIFAKSICEIIIDENCINPEACEIRVK